MNFDIQSYIFHTDGVRFCTLIMPRIFYATAGFSSLLGGMSCGASYALAQAPPLSTSLQGQVGLNTVPSARMDPAGTVRIGTSHLDPYLNSFAGFQIAEPLSVTLRQSAAVSSPFAKAEYLAPGLDLKLRLLTETSTRPAIALGLQSAIGRGRMAGKYLAFSKRYHSFDFTGGIGAGRIDHGKSAALFGGVEYNTPVKGLSVKLDYNPDPYTAERDAIAGFDAPAPWGLGLNYQPRPWVDFGVGVQGTDKIMARISLQTLLQKFPAPDSDTAPFAAAQDTPQNPEYVALESGVSTPRQLGARARIFAQNRAYKSPDIPLTPTVLGLQGPTVTLLKRDIGAQEASAEELWHNTDIDQHKTLRPFKRTPHKFFDLSAFHFTLDNTVSLAEEDIGILHRSSLLVAAQAPDVSALIDNFYAVRVNLNDNLDHLSDTRAPDLFPVRSNIADFAQNRISMDTLFSAYTHSFTPNLHLSLLGGYLEEMYSGTGGEILYRPYGQRFAIGAESWLAMKRDPLAPLGMGLTGEAALTGHLNGWYDLPLWDMTLKASIGQYLGTDKGGTLGFEKTLPNGAKLSGFVTMTNTADLNPFGEQASLYNGIRLTVPLGGYPYVPRNTDTTLRMEPLGRNAGQRLNNPIPLYDVTEPFSAEHIAAHWSDIKKK